MGFGIGQLVERLSVAKAQRDDAAALHAQRSAVERDNLATLRRLRADTFADPVELHNAQIRAAAYERSVRELWDNLQAKEAAVRAVESTLAHQRRLLDEMKFNMQRAEQSVVAFKKTGMIAALERQIAELRKREAHMIADRDNQATQVTTLEAELTQHGY